MKMFQTIVYKILALIALGVGSVLVSAPVCPYCAALVGKVGCCPYMTYVGGALAIMGLIALYPANVRRKHKTISFPGIHGDVVIELDSVEATLNRVIGRKPEVKRIKVTVDPSEDNRKARVTADVVLYKGVGTSAREAANRVSNYVSDAAVHILGVEDVTEINLNVRGILLDAEASSQDLGLHEHHAVHAEKPAEPVMAVNSEPAPEPEPEPMPEPMPEPVPVAAEPEPVESDPIVAEPVRVEEDLPVLTADPTPMRTIEAEDDFSPVFGAIPRTEEVLHEEDEPAKDA